MDTTKMAQKHYLFTDLRHIQCGDLRWQDAVGNNVPLYPSVPRMTLRASTGMLPRGVRFEVQKARKMPPFSPRNLKPSHTMLYDGGVYRSWTLRAQYRKEDKEKGCYSKAPVVKLWICYLESRDGFEWSEKGRSRIEPVGFGYDGFTVFMDPKGSAAERYKAVFMANAPQEQWLALWEQYQQVHPRYRDTRLPQNGRMSCLYGAVSPDGLDWTTISKPLLIHKSDTDTRVWFDPSIDRYVMYTRLYWEGRRLVARAETEDFRHWDHVEPLIWPDLESPLSQDIYTNGYTPYPGLSHYHLMFPMIYQRYTQGSDIHLYSSVDTMRWNRVPGGPIIPRGDPGDWDFPFLGTVAGLVPFGRDRVGTIYSATRFPHKYPRWKHVLDAGNMAWAWWPKGRLCAVKADEEGEFFTFPIVPAGRTLRLNMRCDPAGLIQVGIQSVPNRSVSDCDPVIGDNLSALVRWKGKIDTRAPKGRPVVLHFRMRAADLFGFEWA